MKESKKHNSFRHGKAVPPSSKRKADQLNQRTVPLIDNVIRNAQGDIVMLVPASATANNYIAAEYDYSAYGEILVSSGTISKHFPFRYRGYYYDADLGMYNLGTRYYDPEIGRFLNADGVLSGVGGPIKGYNMFAYCFNNPVNMDDPSGNWPQWLKNCVKWVTKNVFKPAVDFIKDKTKNCNVALSRSQSFNLQIGNYSVGGSIGFSVHTNGDVMVQYDVSSSASTSGGFGISSQSIQGVDFVPTLDLSDYSTDISFNATAPIPNTPISGDGSLTYKQNYSNDGTATYPSISMGVGAAFPSSTKTELGLSMGISKSQKIYEFNIYDKFKKMYIGIMEW